MPASTTRSGGPPRGVWRPTPRSRLAGPALIDTHIWLWYLDGMENGMSADALTLLRHTAQSRGLLVSDMSAWEIGTKAAKGKLTLAPSVEGWLAGRGAGRVCISAAGSHGTAGQHAATGSDPR